MKFLTKALIIAVSLAIFTSCSSTIVDPDDMEFAYYTDTLGVRTGSSQTRTDSNPFRVGVLQYGSHPSLDNVFNGVKRGLDNSDLNISFEYHNANFDDTSSENIAKKMIYDNFDVIIPIGTTPAISTYNAATYSQTPIIFSAVSDPIGAGLLSNLIVTNSYVTGTATVFDEKAQLDLMLGLQPDITSIGVIYSIFEPNSISELARLRTEATSRGIEIVSAGVGSVDNITDAVYSIITRVDALTNISDNNIVNNLDLILEIADIAEIPVYGTEEEQVLAGCVAGQGLDYFIAGQKSAEIAISVLQGKSISTIPVTVYDEVEFYYNDEKIEKFGLDVSSFKEVS